MTWDHETMILRLERLERSTWRTRVLSGALGIALLGTWVSGAAWPPNPQRQDTVRTRLLVIEDTAGRERIVLGAPMPDGRQQVGMKILDPTGAEQVGLGIKADGSVSMGFDVMPGVGNPANRERLNLGVTATGRGWIRYLDNETRARLFLRLDSTDAPVVQFLDWPNAERIMVRQLGFAGEHALEWRR